MAEYWFPVDGRPLQAEACELAVDDRIFWNREIPRPPWWRPIARWHWDHGARTQLWVVRVTEPSNSFDTMGMEIDWSTDTPSDAR